MVTVFSKNNCIQCKTTKRFLEQHEISPIERNIGEQPKYISQFKSEGFVATPVVKLPNDQAFSDFHPDQLNQLA